MQMTSPAHALVQCVLLVVLAAVIARRVPFYGAALDREAASGRYLSVDGLRGFLALAVFFHHAVVSQVFHSGGRWGLPDSRFWLMMGQTGVAVFFMITGFLFWSKGLRSPGQLKVQPLLWSRVTRLVPMYAFSIACVFVVALATTGLALREAPWKIASEALAWASFGFGDVPPINGLPHSYVVNAGVQWSLAYEWRFYLVLPLLLLWCRGWPFVLLLVVAGLLAKKYELPLVWHFMAGIVAATVVQRGWLARWPWRSSAASLIALASLTSVLTGFDTAYDLAPAAVLFIALLCFAHGTDLWGLLVSRPARLLGMISYSVYLMHGIVLFSVLSVVKAVAPGVLGQPLAYWSIVSAIGCTLVALCALTYRWVEHPFLHRPMPDFRDALPAGEPAR